MEGLEPYQNRRKEVYKKVIPICNGEDLEDNKNDEGEAELELTEDGYVLTIPTSLDPEHIPTAYYNFFSRIYFREVPLSGDVSVWVGDPTQGFLLKKNWLFTVPKRKEERAESVRDNLTSFISSIDPSEPILNFRMLLEEPSGTEVNGHKIAEPFKLLLEGDTLHSQRNQTIIRANEHLYSTGILLEHATSLDLPSINELMKHAFASRTDYVYKNHPNPDTLT